MSASSPCILDVCESDFWWRILYTRCFENLVGILEGVFNHIDHLLGGKAPYFPYSKQNTRINAKHTIFYRTLRWIPGWIRSCIHLCVSSRIHISISEGGQCCIPDCTPLCRQLCYYQLHSYYLHSHKLHAMDATTIFVATNFVVNQSRIEAEADVTRV